MRFRSLPGDGAELALRLFIQSPDTELTPEAVPSLPGESSPLLKEASKLSYANTRLGAPH